LVSVAREYFVNNAGDLSTFSTSDVMLASAIDNEHDRAECFAVIMVVS
jgi:hypothetical protein